MTIKNLEQWVDAVENELRRNAWIEELEDWEKEQLGITE